MTFRLLTDSDVLLAELPGTVRPTGVLGSPRSLEWERAPYAEVWRAVGDNLSTEPPSLTLSGAHAYRTADEALAHMAEIQAAVSGAAKLTWWDRLYCNLRTDRRGMYLPSYNEQAHSVTHLLNLYPVVALTPEVLAANQGISVPAAGDNLPPNATQTTTTILIAGVPIEVPVWRTNA